MKKKRPNPEKNLVAAAARIIFPVAGLARHRRAAAVVDFNLFAAFTAFKGLAFKRHWLPAAAVRFNLGAA